VVAPAAGTVVLAEPLVVRGNAVVIDHGAGQYTGYWHLSQLVASAGQSVKPGDLIGLVGTTGLSTGNHLHWEMRLHGVAVDPLQWVQQVFPQGP
jgi:murein DD-endopeptidase MepM/ murein hydrolase activator NlpD